MIEQIQELVENLDYYSVNNSEVDVNFGVPTLFESEKEQVKVYKKIEQIIRISYEYRSFINYIKSELNITKCVITNEDTEEIGVDFHHYPLTLYEIVDIVYTTLSEKYDSLTSFDISKEVMKLHYQKKIGLIPLVKTLHEKAHAQNISFPRNFILFNFESLLESDYIIKDEYQIKIRKASNTTYEDFIKSCKSISWPT